MNGDPFEVFEKIIFDKKIEFCFEKNVLGTHFFFGGAVGYWGYDMKDRIETLASTALVQRELPDAFWMFYDGIIVIDHFTNRYYLAGTEEGIAALQNEIHGPDSPAKKTDRFDYSILPTISKEIYLNHLMKIKNYIASGDVYEVNLAQRFDLKIESKDLWTDFNLFKSLVETSPSPFSALLRCGDLSVISSSPERFLKIVDHEAESRPIKGTRPRRKDFFEDEALYFDLLHSEKDRAENVMIVDLVRNDLGRVSETGSVRVENLFEIENYSTVFQMVSTIKSKISSRFNVLDAVKACFPPGSMTGAPKIRAMQIIEELEPYKRGVYSGVLGYIGYDGNADLSVVIRTLVMNGSKGYFQTGGAIVWDSLPLEEYRECLDKTEGMIRALERLKGQ